MNKLSVPRIKRIGTWTGANEGRPEKGKGEKECVTVLLFYSRWVWGYHRKRFRLGSRSRIPLEVRLAHLFFRRMVKRNSVVLFCRVFGKDF